MLLASGIAWKRGSPSSKRTGWFGMKTFQFIVNDVVIQSLSIKAKRLDIDLEIVGWTANQEPRACRIGAEQKWGVPRDDAFTDLAVDPSVPDVGRGVKVEIRCCRAELAHARSR